MPAAAGLPRLRCDMEITQQTLERFTKWLTDRGRGRDTAITYCSHLRKCASDKNGLTARLVGRLSPNTKRTNLAALAAWAKFSKDTELRDMLEEIRLPPARRVTTKLPLERDAWGKLITHLRTAELPRRDRILRHVMVIIAIRGLRCGDTLRIRRKDIKSALSTGKLVFEGKGSKRSSFAAAPFLPELTELADIPGDWECLADLVSRTHKAAKMRVWRRLKTEGKNCGIGGLYPHQLRRTYATNFLAELQGDPRSLIKLQKHMDWSDLATAASYADAVDLDDLDSVGGRMLATVTAR